MASADDIAVVSMARLMMERMVIFMTCSHKFCVLGCRCQIKLCCGKKDGQMEVGCESDASFLCADLEYLRLRL